MKIELTKFLGSLPSIDPYKLPSEYAADLEGPEMTSGALAAMGGESASVTATASTDRIILIEGSWLYYTADADAVTGAVDESRIYVTRGGTTAPQVIYDGVARNLAVSPPSTKPTVTLSSAIDPDETEQSILYAYTFVTAKGEESAPSPLSSELTWTSGVNVVVTTPTVATGQTTRNITLKRIYRSVTSDSGATELYFITEIPLTQASFTHNMTTNPPSEAITCTDYDAPPAGLTGIVSLPNGVMAAFKGRTIYFCEPYVHHAWPLKYTQTVNDDIVGLAAYGSSLAVLTNGTPYVLQGTHPEQMLMERSEVSYPCLSKRGIVDTGYSVIYPSPDGLVTMASGTGASLLTGKLWSPKKWRELVPSSFRAAQHNGKYVFSYQIEGTALAARKLAAVDMSGAEAYFIPLGFTGIVDMWMHPESSTLFALKSNRTSVVTINADNALPISYSWQSRPFEFQATTSLSAAKIEGRAPATGTPAFAATISLLMDNGTTKTVSITTPNKAVRLPSGLVKEVTVKITGNWTVTRAIVAQSMEEIA